MDHDAYLAGIAELYAAEVLGEGLASPTKEPSSASPRGRLSVTVPWIVNFNTWPQLINNPMAGFVQ
jgi:hypothetical protein